MKTIIIIGIIIAGIIGAVTVFASISPSTWQDTRTTFQRDARPDEVSEKIECLSKGGLWTGNSCSVPDFNAPKVIECTGKCITETVTRIIDGDTIYTANYKIRLALTDTPEKDDPRFQEATLFTAMHCPVGSMITIDQDDLQPYDIYGRVLGKVYCGNDILNEIILKNGHGIITTEYCTTSEFSEEIWAQSYGCKNSIISSANSIPVKTSEPVQSSYENNCEPSYPDVCIPSHPPDLNCGDIPYKNFSVVGSDPHGFDGNKDGIGCEK